LAGCKRDTHAADRGSRRGVDSQLAAQGVVPVAADRSSSPLVGLQYGLRAHDLCRFLPDPLDAAVAAVVGDARGMTSDQRESLRTALDTDACYTLVAFSKRRSAAALRDGNLRKASDALYALALLTISKMDSRDFSSEFQRYAIGRLRGDVEREVRAAAAVSEPGAGSALLARPGPTTLQACGLMEVTSSYGLGFIQTGGEHFAPVAELTSMAVRIADLIDTTTRYAVSDLQCSSLPSVWFGRDQRTPLYVPTAGCVSIHAPLKGGAWYGPRLLLFLAELESDREVLSLIERATAASDAEAPRVAIGAGRLLLLMIGAAWRVGAVAEEDGASLRHLAATLQSEIGE
jgi:hypothetical protein